MSCPFVVERKGELFIWRRILIRPSHDSPELAIDSTPGATVESRMLIKAAQLQIYVETGSNYSMTYKTELRLKEPRTSSRAFQLLLQFQIAAREN